MTTRSRVWWIRAAASVALAGGTVAVSAAPVSAAPPSIRILSVSSERVASGESVRVRFRATNNNARTEKVFVAVSGGLRCAAGCSAAPNIRSGQSQTFDATVVAPKVRVGEESGRNLAVSVRIGTKTAFDHKMIIVVGGDKPASGVSRISGRVRDADGKAVGGVSLAVRDSAGHDYRTTSNGRGAFSIRSSDSRPIAAGPITIVARKDGYRTTNSTVQGTAGAVTTVRLTLAAVAAPATTSPSPTAQASTPVVADEPRAAASLAAPLAAPRSADQDDDGPPLFTILGGLLIAAGLGTLALMVIRRRRGVDPGSTQVMPAPPGAFMTDAPTAVLPAVPPHGGFPRPPDGYNYRGPAR